MCRGTWHISSNNACSKEKWDSSGANEAVGRVTASIPDSTKQYVSSIFRRDQLRGITVVFGIGEERPFYMEKNPSLLIERLRHNLSFFYMNYLLFTGVLFTLMCIINPFNLIVMGILAAAWVWLARASADGTLRLGSK